MKQKKRMLEEVVQSQGQRVGSGALLLGLSAWHKYPDIVVLGSETAQVFQKDNLVKQGGVVTVDSRCDIHKAPGSDEDIYWLLQLASLRYYGDEVEICRSFMSGATRLSISQLQQVAFGVLLAEWKDGVPHLEAAYHSYGFGASGVEVYPGRTYL